MIRITLDEMENGVEGVIEHWAYQSYRTLFDECEYDIEFTLKDIPDERWLWEYNEWKEEHIRNLFKLIVTD